MSHIMHISELVASHRVAFVGQRKKYRCFSELEDMMI